MEELIVKISALFKKYGIKSVTMDDISRELGISKKTLYQHFENKNDVVYKIADFEIISEFEELKELCAQSVHVIDQLRVVSKYIIEKNFSLNPSLIYSLSKYYPKIWEESINKRQEFIHNLITKNLSKGIKQGMYRGNLDLNIITPFYLFLLNVRSIESHMNWSIENLDQNFDTIFLYHIRGIATKEGIEYLEKQFSIN